jgi:cytochrome b561
MLVDQAAEWSLAQRRLHGWTAAFVTLAFALAWVMVGVPLPALLLKFLLYQLHKTLGLAALALTLARGVLRWRRGRPAWNESIAPWQRQAARVVHAALYGLLLVVPVLGYFTAASAPAAIPTFFLGFIPIPHVIGPDAAAFAVLAPVHRAAAVVLIVLACGHAAAAWHNQARGLVPLRTMWRGGRPRHR